MSDPIMGDTPGTLYILCFDRPIGNPSNSRALASHYLGWCRDLPHRLSQHRSGRGQPLTAAAVSLGIAWQVYCRPGTPAQERALKARYKNTPCLCPRCAASRGRRGAVGGFQSIDQLVLPLDEELPEITIGRMDWLELRIMQEWRAARMPTPIDLAAIDDLL